MATFLLYCYDMTSRFAVPSVSVAKAKDGLPTYLERAREHMLQIITRHDRDEVALVDLADLRELLHDHTFQTEVSIHSNEATVNLPQFRIIGIGADVDEAAEDALAKLREYALQYLRRFNFYKETDRRDLYPLVMRFLATPGNEQLDLLVESDTIEAEPVPA
jgi:hypothetical protein